MTNILILTDFSPMAQKAVEFGYQMAQQLHSNIILCNVMNIPAEIPQFEVPILPLSGYDHMLEENKRDLFQLKSHLDKRSATQGFQPQITCLEEVGRVTDTVLRLAAKHQADLVLLGAHQSKGLVEWMLGNHVNELIEVARISVMIIPAEATAKKIERLALALDNPAKQQIALDQVHALAASFNAEMFLFRVQDDDVKREMTKMAQITTILKKMKAILKVYLRTALYGPVEKQLRAMCASEKIDLLVMIHQKKSFLHDLLLTGHSKRMSAQTTIPLMIIPSSAI